MPAILISVFCLIIACDRFPDPSYELLKNYTFTYQNQPGQRFFAGEWVNDSVSFMAFNYASTEREKIKVLFEVTKGDGSVTSTETFTNNNGVAVTKWQLGYTSTEQVLRAKSYDMSGKYLTSTDLVEYGFITGKWNKWTGDPDGLMMGMVADTVNKVTLMVTNNTVYKPGDRYYLWEALTDPLLAESRTINIDRNGVIYVTTWTGAIVKSTDHGKSWEPCTKPYPDRPYYIYLSVSNDNYIWAFDSDHPTKFSGDGGANWTEAGGEISSIGYGDVFRLKDGSLLIHGSNCCSLHRSSDNGTTWKSIPTPGYSIKLFVDENDEIFIVTQEETGFSIFRSTDNGATFNRVHTVYPEWSTSMNNTFSKWGSFYYVLIPGYGILKSTDLIHFEDYYRNSNLMDLFIDHKGLLIGKDRDLHTVYYMKNQ